MPRKEQYFCREVEIWSIVSECDQPLLWRHRGRRGCGRFVWREPTRSGEKVWPASTVSRLIQEVQRHHKFYRDHLNASWATRITSGDHHCPTGGLSQVTTITFNNDNDYSGFFWTFRKKTQGQKNSSQKKLKQIFEKLKQIIQKLNNLQTINWLFA